MSRHASHLRHTVPRRAQLLTTLLNPLSLGFTEELLFFTVIRGPSRGCLYNIARLETRNSTDNDGFLLLGGVERTSR